MPLIIRSTGWEDYMDPAGGSWIKTLIMGSPDVGKTRSASFWPKPIFADCEDGRMSLADRNVPYGRIRSTADMDALMNELQFDAKRPPEKRKYLTLVIDTIDHYQKIVISERLAAEKKEALSGWADWGWLDGHMQQFVEKLLNLPMNIIVNVHFKVVTEGEDDAKKVTQALRLKGDVKDWLLESFDLIGMMESSYKAVDGKRVRVRNIRWHNEPAYPLLKDRSGSLPQFTEVDFTDGDYTRVFEAITANVDSLPKSEELEQIEVDDATVEAAGPDEQGGPVEVGKLPEKRAAKRAVAKKVPAKVRDAVPGEAVTTEVKPKPSGGSTSAPPEQAATDVPIPSSTTDTQAPASHDDAVALVKAELGATEVLTETPKPEKYCGKQPESHQKFPAVAGCDKDLSTEIPAKVNLALLRAKTMLCTDCFENWKTA